MFIRIWIRTTRQLPTFISGGFNVWQDVKIWLLWFTEGVFDKDVILKGVDPEDAHLTRMLSLLRSFPKV